MNQYERIVSYIYRYDKGEKGTNVGFAKVERRGQHSRITVQLRASQTQKIHEGYLFWQQPEGIRTIPIGRLGIRGGNFVLKADTDTEKLFGTEQALEKMDGIFINVEKDVYYATNWKNDSFHLGDWREWQNGIMGASAAVTEDKTAGEGQEDTGVRAAEEGQREEGVSEQQEREIAGTIVESQGAVDEAGAKEQRAVVKNQGTVVGMAVEGRRAAAGMTVRGQGAVNGMTVEGRRATDGMTMEGRRAAAGMTMEGQRAAARTVVKGQGAAVGTVVEGQRAAGIVAENQKTAESGQEIKEVITTEEVNGWEAEDKNSVRENGAPSGQRTDNRGDAAGKTSEQSAKDIQIQSICSACPFKRQNYDYGKKILMTFPTMKPFSAGIARACVRMELQDIGCLPIASWQLAGNRFLLHGYYCYRHLLFAQLEEGNYVLGVPGVFSDKERRNAARFGFDTFQAIGEPVAKQGVFGYWLMDMKPAVS